MCVLSQGIVTHPPPVQTFPLEWTILHCECSAGVSGCQLASVYYSCAVYREARLAISNNSLQMGQGNENKACVVGTFRVWGFVSKLCPSSSLGATLKLLLVWLGWDFTWWGRVRFAKRGPCGKQVCFFIFTCTLRTHLWLGSEAFLFFRSLFAYCAFQKRRKRNGPTKGVEDPLAWIWMTGS